MSIGLAQDDTLIIYPVNNPALKDYNLRKICPDKTGKLWFTTDKGVISYDGNDITVFDHKEGDSSSLTTNSTGRLYLDDSNNLYIWTVPGQVYLNTKTGKVTPLNIRIRDEDKPKIAFPYPLTPPFIDDDASIWAGMYGVGFIHYSRKTKETIYYTSKDNAFFKATTVYVIRGSISDKNILWLGTDDGIYRFNKTTKEIGRHFKATNQKDSSVYDPAILNMDAGKDTIWFTIPLRGVGCYDIKSGSYTIFPNKDQKTGKINDVDISFFQRKNKDEYYISSTDKLPGIFNLNTHTYSFATKTFQDMPAVDVRHFVSDKSDHLWSLIFFQLYLARNNASRLNTFSMASVPGVDGTGHTFKNIVWDEHSKLYYAAFQTGDKVFFLDSTMKLVKAIPIASVNDKANEQSIILDIGVDEMGRIWLCGNNVWIYDDRSKKFIAAGKLNPGLNFKNMLFQNIIFRKNYLYLQPSSPPCNAIYRVDIKQRSCDSILLPAKILSDTSGTYQHGPRKMDVLQIDKDARFAYFCYNMSLFQLDLITLKERRILTLTDSEKLFEQIYNMFWYRLDDMNNIWVLTTKGIQVYEPENFHVIKKFPIENDSYGLQLFNVDGKNIMGFLHSNGLSLLDYKSNNQFNLKLSDGLITTVNAGGACVNGMLFIGARGYFHYIPLTAVVNNDLKRRCYLSKIQVFNKPIKTDTVPEFLHTLNLTHDQNFIGLTFSSTEFDQVERLEYRYKLDGVDDNWIYVNYLNRTISYNDLRPGSYVFHAAIKDVNGEWSKNDVNLSINIMPAWWQTTWFNVLSVLLAAIAIYLFVRWRIKGVRRQEQLKGKYEKELLELEAKALRAQMNPHFIFNCMNSIKSLMQQNQQDKGIIYLTTFSKLLRTIFQNSDKREITLFDEIETCKLYTQLESMRFGNKFTYSFSVDDTIDLKSFLVPALILQPFIENAIWHGIMPKEDGGYVNVMVKKDGENVCCIIDDDGIGREMSKQSKFKGDVSTHESKGVHLTQTRLDLDNLLNERNASLRIIDKKDEHGKSAGTTVSLIFNVY
ncbi:MAG: histidine kinase [Panacibacter sp.]